MPYADVSQYVLASVAIPEIARCYFGGDTNKAESDARIAAQEGALPVFRDTPFLHINRERWHHDHIHWSSIFDPLYFPRADLLKIYPDLWRSLQSPDNETTSTSTAGAETRCREWLENLMRSGSKKKSKSEYFTDAGQFQVGTRAFDRAWAQAIKNTGKIAWKIPGPRSEH